MSVQHYYPNIFWATHAGCSKISPGCDNCAALVLSQRCSENSAFPWDQILTDNDWNGQVRFAETQLSSLFDLRKRGLYIWVNQLGDLFHQSVTDEQRDRIFGVMARLGHQKFIVTTRRAQAMADYLNAPGRAADVQYAAREWDDVRGIGQISEEWPLPNVIAAVSVSNQAEANTAVPILLATAAVKRMVYVAPILGSINLSAWPGIDWLIVRPEEGEGRRPPTPSWVTSLKDWAVAQSIPFYFKGWGQDIDGETEAPLLNTARGSIDVQALPEPSLLRRMINGIKWEQMPLDSFSYRDFKQPGE